MQFDMKSFWGRVGGIIYAYVVEHNIVNVFRRNFHRIDENAYRSSQPTTYQLRKIAKKYGIKTVINFRGYPDGSPLQYLEEECCRELGVKLVYFKVYSRKIPSYENVRDAKRLFDEVEYPILMHCKSGADRASLMSVLYMYFKMGKSVEESMQSQLKLIPFGHVKESKTGLIDHFFNAYLEYQKEGGVLSLLEWSEKVMIRQELHDTFRPLLAFDILVDKILRRE